MRDFFLIWSTYLRSVTSNLTQIWEKLKLNELTMLCTLRIFFFLFYFVLVLNNYFYWCLGSLASRIILAVLFSTVNIWSVSNMIGSTHLAQRFRMKNIYFLKNKKNNYFLADSYAFSYTISLKFSIQLSPELTHFSSIYKSLMDGLSTQYSLLLANPVITLLETNYDSCSISSIISSGYLCINQIL